MYVLIFKQYYLWTVTTVCQYYFFSTSFFSTDKGLSHPPSTFDSNSKIL